MIVGRKVVLCGVRGRGLEGSSVERVWREGGACPWRNKDTGVCRRTGRWFGSRIERIL